jgi:hypothetical protein
MKGGVAMTVTGWLRLRRTTTPLRGFGIKAAALEMESCRV